MTTVVSWLRPPRPPVTLSGAPPRPLPPGLLDAVERIARGYGVTPVEVLGRGRTKLVTLARHHVWAVARWTLDLSYPELGRIFDVHHTTVILGVTKHEETLQ